MWTLSQDITRLLLAVRMKYTFTNSLIYLLTYWPSIWDLSGSINQMTTWRYLSQPCNCDCDGAEILMPRHFVVVCELTSIHDDILSNPNRNNKGNPNPTNPNTRYHCEYGTLNSMFATFVCFSCTMDGVSFQGYD